MGIDLEHERLIDAVHVGPSDLGARRGDRPPRRSFRLGAITKGVNGQRLEALRVGSCWITGVKALQHHAEAQSAAKLAGSARADGAREFDRLGL